MDGEDTIAFVIPFHTFFKSAADSRNALTVQEHLTQKKVAKSNDVTLQLAINGNTNDSVSQSVNPTRQPPRSRTSKKLIVNKKRALAPKSNPTPNLRNEGGKHRTLVKVSLKNILELISSRNGLDQFAPATSAKEKTGADPLAQTTIPLDAVKHSRQVLDMMEENVPKKGGLNWWGRERHDRPPSKTVRI